MDGGYSATGRSWQAEDQRSVGYARAAEQSQQISLRVIAYDNPDGTSLPQLMACKIERDFIHKLKFWEKMHYQAYAPCYSVRYLLEISGK